MMETESFGGHLGSGLFCPLILIQPNHLLKLWPNWKSVAIGGGGFVSGIIRAKPSQGASFSSSGSTASGGLKLIRLAPAAKDMPIADLR